MVNHNLIFQPLDVWIGSLKWNFNSKSHQQAETYIPPSCIYTVILQQEVVLLLIMLSNNTLRWQGVKLLHCNTLDPNIASDFYCCEWCCPGFLFSQHQPRSRDDTELCLKHTRTHSHTHPEQISSCFRHAADAPYWLLYHHFWYYYPTYSSCQLLSEVFFLFFFYL